jgi:hypothetical protein
VLGRDRFEDGLYVFREIQHPMREPVLGNLLPITRDALNAQPVHREASQHV